MRSEGDVSEELRAQISGNDPAAAGLDRKKVVPTRINADINSFDLVELIFAAGMAKTKADASYVLRLGAVKVNGRNVNGDHRTVYIASGEEPYNVEVLRRSFRFDHEGHILDSDAWIKVSERKEDEVNVPFFQFQSFTADLDSFGPCTAPLGHTPEAQSLELPTASDLNKSENP